jgi:hypothetical protein
VTVRRASARGARDELGQLTRHFDGLLDTIANQDEVRRAALKTIADEASRRRALFEHERDGVVILNEDGSVLRSESQVCGNARLCARCLEPPVFFRLGCAAQPGGTGTPVGHIG